MCLKYVSHCSLAYWCLNLWKNMNGKVGVSTCTVCLFFQTLIITCQSTCDRLHRFVSMSAFSYHFVHFQILIYTVKLWMKSHLHLLVRKNKEVILVCMRVLCFLTDPVACKLYVWCLPEKYGISRKSVTLGRILGAGFFGEVYEGDYKKQVNFFFFLSDFFLHFLNDFLLDLSAFWIMNIMETWYCGSILYIV